MKVCGTLSIERLACVTNYKRLAVLYFPNHLAGQTPVIDIPDDLSAGDYKNLMKQLTVRSNYPKSHPPLVDGCTYGA